MMEKSLSLFFLKRLVLSPRSGSLMRRISFLSFFAILLSVTVFLIVLFVMNGMNKSIQSRIIVLDPNITATFKDSHEIELPENSLYQGLRFDSYDLIVRTADGQFRGASAVGYKQSDFKFWTDKLIALRKKNKSSLVFDEDSSSELNEGEIAIGVDIARNLGLLEGDQVTLIPIETLLLSQTERPLFEKVTIKKIVTSDLPDLDSNALFFNRETSLKSFRASLSKVSGYHFWLNNPDDLDEAVTDLKKNSFKSVESWKEKNSSLFFALLMEKTMIGIFLGLAGLVASTSILTVLALIMSQKQSDIAILKTLGLSNRKTLLLFMQMGLWISLSAIGIGTFLGLSISYYLEKHPLELLPHIYYDANIPAYVDLRFAGLVLVVSTLLAILGCYLPSRSTLQIQPAILLKQKS
ncbi:MAG: ABC transporter permease [Moraxellaceae bacterium]|nr:ABC transporter permease [Pseudobdellovibrionaceae bacterium]